MGFGHQLSTSGAELSLTSDLLAPCGWWALVEKQPYARREQEARRELRWCLRQAGLQRAAEATADHVAANALRTAWLHLQLMERRRYARREQEARRTRRLRPRALAQIQIALLMRMLWHTGGGAGGLGLPWQWQHPSRMARRGWGMPTQNRGAR